MAEQLTSWLISLKDYIFNQYSSWKDFYWSCSQGGRVGLVIGAVILILVLYVSIYTLDYKARNNSTLMGKCVKSLKNKNISKSMFASTSVMSIVNPISGNR
jgi:hypothetical protein